MNRAKLTKSIVLKLLKYTNFDLKIQHHWVADSRITINSFRHKGYWFHGRNRERATINAFQKLIQVNSTVLEVGGHIGYLTAIFVDLAGPGGKVVVFEPSAENRRYLDKNIPQGRDVTVEHSAVSSHEGEADFYVEDLTGQNNSLVADYQVFQDNVARAGEIKVNTSVQRVKLTTLSAYCRLHELMPDFIKIDIEGAEKDALFGSEDVLRDHQPILMVEVTRDHEEIYTFMDRLGYDAYDEDLAPLAGRFLAFNHFFIPRSRKSVIFGSI